MINYSDEMHKYFVRGVGTMQGLNVETGGTPVKTAL